jgi:hypothetical protein
VAWEAKKWHRGSIYTVRWNHAGDLFATGSNDKVVQLQRFEPRTCSAAGAPLTIKPRSGTVRTLAFMGWGGGQQQLAAAGGGDFGVGAFDCETGVAVGRWSGHAKSVNALCGSGASGGLFSGSSDGTVKLWDMRTSGGCQASYQVGPAAATALAVAPTLVNRPAPGNHHHPLAVAVGLDDGSLLVIDTRMGVQTHAGSPHTREVRSLDYCPASGAAAELLLSCSYDGTVCVSRADRVADTIDSAVVARHADKVTSSSWCPADTGENLPGFVSTSADRTVRIWAPLKAF